MPKRKTRHVAYSKKYRKHKMRKTRRKLRQSGG